MTHHIVTGAEVREIGRLIIAFSEALGVEPNSVSSAELCERVRDLALEAKRLEANEAFLEHAVHLVLGCCDGSDVPCEDRAAEVLYEHVRNGTKPTTQRSLSGLLRGMARRVGAWRRTSAEHYAALYQAVEDYSRNDEQVLADSQRLAEKLAAATALADRLLAMFATGEKGHPGRPCVRTGWIDETAIAELRARRGEIQ